MHKRASTSFIVLFLLTLLFSWRTPGAASAHSLSKSPVAKTGTSTPAMQSSSRIGSKSHTTQDPAWIAHKLAYQVTIVKGKNGRKIPKIVATLRFKAQSLATFDQLDTSYVDAIWEPSSVSSTDVNGKNYTDQYMAYLCGPGASAVALDYWPQVNDRAFGTYVYNTDPSGKSTTWNNSHTRSYLTYLAQGVNPPSYATPGEMTWYDKNNNLVKETYVQDLVDALNWEAAVHDTSVNWRNYFYTVVWYNNLTLTTLKNYVADDISVALAPIVLVNDDYLPDWSPKIHTSHYVAITGYDNNAKKFTYEETCGVGSCPTIGGPYGKGWGNHTVDQQQLLNGIEADGGALIW